MSIPPDPFIALLSHIAHEMRAPLSAAQGYGRMLASGRYGALTDGQSRAVEATARCCERLSDLAEQLSLLGKIERGDIQPAAGTTLLEPLLRAIAAAHVPHADHPVQVAHVPWSNSADGGSPGDTADVDASARGKATVRAETALLRRSLTALLDAVVRSAPDGSIVQLVARVDPSHGPAGATASSAVSADASSSAVSSAAVSSETVSSEAVTSEAPSSESVSSGAMPSGDALPGAVPSRAGSDGTSGPRIVVVIAPADRVETLWMMDDEALEPLNDFEPGLGLGLAIARRVVRAAGGRAGAHRQHGALAMRLTLPLVS